MREAVAQITPRSQVELKLATGDEPHLTPTQQLCPKLSHFDTIQAAQLFLLINDTFTGSFPILEFRLKADVIHVESCWVVGIVQQCRHTSKWQLELSFENEYNL